MYAYLEIYIEKPPLTAQKYFGLFIPKNNVEANQVNLRIYDLEKKESNSVPSFENP